MKECRPKKKKRAIILFSGLEKANCGAEIRSVAPGVWSERTDSAHGMQGML